MSIQYEKYPTSYEDFLLDNQIAQVYFTLPVTVHQEMCR